MPFHARCLSIEALLRARINDLEHQVDTQREEMEARSLAAFERERMLMDRIIVISNPVAARAVAELNRSDAPTPRPPTVARGAGPIRPPLPGQSRRPPVLTPQASGFRPAAPPPAVASSSPEDVTADQPEG